MKTILIGGKKYKVKISWGRVLQFESMEANFIKTISLAVHGSMPDATESEIEAEISKRFERYVHILMANTIWHFLKRRWFGFKPFLFKWRLKNNITPQEFRDGYRNLVEAIRMEDREGGN